MKIEQIDRTHRTKTFLKDGGNRKSRPIIVNFVRYADRRNVCVNKKVENILIPESLTKERMSKLKDGKEQYGFKQVWKNLMEKFYLKKIIAFLLCLKFQLLCTIR